MATPRKYANNFLPIKYMLSSYRALVDGRLGISHLERLLEDSDYLTSEWKVLWVGTCATLRTSIDLFRRDSRLCLSTEIGDEIKVEWDLIKAHRKEHAIYWDFLKKERDNIVHEYSWTAYEAWLEPDGTVQTPPSILGRLVAGSEARPKLLMNSGEYEGRDSLDLLKESATWVQNRIFSAIDRAGFDPEEKRGAYDFRPLSKTNVPNIGILAAYLNQND